MKHIMKKEKRLPVVLNEDQEALALKIATSMKELHRLKTYRYYVSIHSIETISAAFEQTMLRFKTRNRPALFFTILKGGGISTKGGVYEGSSPAVVQKGEYYLNKK